MHQTIIYSKLIYTDSRKPHALSRIKLSIVQFVTLVSPVAGRGGGGGQQETAGGRHLASRYTFINTSKIKGSRQTASELLPHVQIR